MKQKSFKVFVSELGKEVVLESRGKKGTYQVSFHFDGAHVRRSLKTSNKIQAERNLEAVVKELIARSTLKSIALSSNSNSATKQLTLLDGLEYYIGTLRDKGCEETRAVGQVRTRIMAFIEFEHSLGVTDFEGVLPTHGDLYYRGLTTGTFKTAGKQAKSVNTACGYVRSVKAMMKLLSSRSLIPHHPWQHISFTKIANQKTPKPTLEQVNAILKNIEPEYFVAASALAFLGCRVEALLRTTLKQVNLKEGYVHIIPPPHRSKTVERKVPIHPRLMNVIQDYERPDSPFYFCDLRKRARGERKMAGKNLNSAIVRAAKQAGYPAGRKESGLVAHSFRGFFKSHCRKQGLLDGVEAIPREVVDIWQGHADGTIGTEHYFDLELAESIQFMKRVDFGTY